MSKTFTTGQASTALGFMVTGKFIQAMGLTPAASVKGNPIWHTADWTKLCDAISGHLMQIEASPPGDKPTPAPKPKTVASPAAPAPYSDDEDDL